MPKSEVARTHREPAAYGAHRALDALARLRPASTSFMLSASHLACFRFSPQLVAQIGQVASR